VGSSSIKLAIFVSNFDVGGTERQMIELIRRLDRRQFDVHAVCFNRTGEWLHRVVEAGVPIVEFPIESFRKLRTWRQASAFTRWCRQTGITVLQTTDFYTNVFGLPAAAAAGVPLRIGSRRDVNPGRNLAKTVLQRAAYAAAHHVVANSQAAAARLVRERVPRDRIGVIANGLDLTGYAPRLALRTVRRLITVARLRPEKRHNILLDAAARLAGRHPDIEFQIVGDGGELPALMAQCERLGIASRVRFLGHRDDVTALLGGADLFVLPSRSEAFPNGVLEAMASSLPVVACAVGGVPELVEDGRTGLLVPPDDPDALAEAISALVADPPRAWAFGRAGREAVEARYSFEKMTNGFERLYLSLLASKHRAVSRPAPLPT
jgi:glycosyltransferase involved in cell wall biosynthesis